MKKIEIIFEKEDDDQKYPPAVSAIREVSYEDIQVIWPDEKKGYPLWLDGEPKDWWPVETD